MDEIYSERNSHYQFTLTLNFLLLNFSLFSLLTSKRQLGFFCLCPPPPFFFCWMPTLIITLQVSCMSSLLQQIFCFFFLKNHFPSDIIFVMLLSFTELHRNNFLQVYCVLALGCAPAFPLKGSVRGFKYFLYSDLKILSYFLC